MSMEKSLEQLKHIDRRSRQTRHHGTHLNQIYDQNLRTQLHHLATQREQSIVRSTSRRQLEEERKQLIDITVRQIARERRYQPLPLSRTQTELVTGQELSKDNESRPTSSVKFPIPGTSCRLFSHNCQLYPCQPIYQYKSFIKKEHDQTLRKRNESTEDSTKTSNQPQIRQLLTNIQEKKHQQNRRQLALVVQNQHHLVNRYVSMEQTMSRLDEQSRLLRERLTEKKTFGYVRERQHHLSQAIQRHLQITAKFCA